MIFNQGQDKQYFEKRLPATIIFHYSNDYFHCILWNCIFTKSQWTFNYICTHFKDLTKQKKNIWRFSYNQDHWNGIQNWEMCYVDYPLRQKKCNRRNWNIRPKIYQDAEEDRELQISRNTGSCCKTKHWKGIFVCVYEKCFNEAADCLFAECGTQHLRKKRH